MENQTAGRDNVEELASKFAESMKETQFSHIAVEVPGENTKTEWCEEVCEEEYSKL